MQALSQLSYAPVDVLTTINSIVESMRFVKKKFAETQREGELQL